MFPVAGLGARHLPWSRAVPKAMLPVIDRPLVQYAVDEARAAGIEEFVFVTGRGGAVIREHFEGDGAFEALLAERGDEAGLAAAAGARLAPGTAAWARQDGPFGLGHAVLAARDLVGEEPFAVLLPDELLLGDRPPLALLLEVHARTGGSVVALAEVDRDETRRYGIVEVAGEEAGGVVALSGAVEKPDPAEAPSRLAIIGRYVLDPGAFARLAAQAPGAGGEIQLTDALAAAAGPPGLFGVRFGGLRFDCGSPGGAVRAAVACAMRRPGLRRELLPFLREAVLAAGREGP